jgi:hypothetical protein
MRRPVLVIALLVALSATAVVAATAVARSVAAVQSVTVGKTGQPGGQVQVTVFANPVKTKERPVVGATYLSYVSVRFRCAEASEGMAPPTLFEAQAQYGKRYDYGKAFNIRLTKVEVFDAQTGEKEDFTVTLSLKGKVIKTSKKATKGRGTLAVAAPGCTAAPLKWAGKGRFVTEG